MGATWYGALDADSTDRGGVKREQVMENVIFRYLVLMKNQCVLF